MASKGKTVLDLDRYLGQRVTVKFAGGREVTGQLKGYDTLVNLVLDETKEFLRDPTDPYKPSVRSRGLGLTVCKGSSVMLICPVDGTEEIPNPFHKPEEQI